MIRSNLIGIGNWASDITAQELGARWAERFGARLTAIKINDGHRAELSAALVTVGVSHNAVEVARIADNRPVADSENWRVEKHFGQ